MALVTFDRGSRAENYFAEVFYRITNGFFKVSSGYSGRNQNKPSNKQQYVCLSDWVPICCLLSALMQTKLGILTTFFFRLTLCEP